MYLPIPLMQGTGKLLYIMLLGSVGILDALGFFSNSMARNHMKCYVAGLGRDIFSMQNFTATGHAS
jgi:hypothetical protein